jgi:serine/threonine protein kinase/Tol biopolymer transport system component
MPLKAGTLLQQRYRIEGVLGQGGMGAVYHAFDINLGVAVAVKENLFTTAEYARQFELEAKILASLRHPNLPRVTDHFVVEGEGQYLVMDFIQGADLRERLERNGAVTEDMALPWFFEICGALDYLHGRKPPILHRDIKPGNIKVMPEGRAILVDFGLAKVAEKGGTTTTGAKAMTPGFSPPEQYGTGRTDPRTDVYSLGATMYATLTAAIPEDSIERAMGREKLTPIRKRKPEVSSGVARVIEKALAVDPRDRYQTIAEMEAALGSVAGTNRPTVARDQLLSERKAAVTTRRVAEARATRAIQPVKRRRSFPAATVIVVAIVMILAGAAYITLPDLGPRLSALFNQATTIPSTDVQPTDNTPVIEATATSSFVILQPTSSLVPSDVPTSEPAVSSPLLGTATAALMPTATPVGGGVGQIAFASDRTGVPQVYLINLDGTGERWLTSLPEGACQPAWSPDGTRLVFVSPCYGNQDNYPGSSLWLIALDQAGNVSDPEPLPSSPGGDFDPAWAPDGQRLAFTSLRDGRPQIYVMGLDGQGLKNLNGDLAHNRQPVWSPTGSQLLFTTTRGGVKEIWIMPEYGGEVQRFSRANGREDSHADWSSNGLLILFERRKEGGISYLVATRFEDRGNLDSRICVEGRLAGLPMAEARWSPDGNWIAFESWPDGVNHNIAIITSSCSQYVELTSDAGRDFDPAWRPTP